MAFEVQRKSAFVGGSRKRLPPFIYRQVLVNSFALKVGISSDDYDKFSMMPQRGYGLQPRVAASATLGKESDLIFNRDAVASAFCTTL